jgi:adenylosuccinate synthase
MLSSVSLSTREFSVVDAVKAIDVLLNQGKLTKFQREALKQVWVWVGNDVHTGNQMIVVSGAFFWDEAKGKIVDALLKHPKISGVIRANSWENAWHTLVYNGENWVFAIMPCGILTPGKMNYIGNEVVMDPATFVSEELTKVENLLGADETKNRLMIGNCDVVMPWHKIADLAWEPNTSTGKGMAQVHAAKSSRCSIKLDDILNGDWDKIITNMNLALSPIVGEGNKYPNFAALRDAIRPIYNKIPEHLRIFLEHDNEAKRIEYTKQYLQTFVEKLNPYRWDVNAEIQQWLTEWKVFIVESPQSVFLSNSEGTHPWSSTSAHTHAMGVLATVGVAHEKHRGITYNVTKIPSSRVGAGANPAWLVPQNWFSDNGLTIDSLQSLKGKMNYEHVHNEFLKLIQWTHEYGIISRKDKDTLYLGKNWEKVTIQLKDGEHELTIMEALAIANCLEFWEFGARTKRPRVTWALDLMHMKHVVGSQWANFSISRLDAMDGLANIPLVIGYTYLGDKTLKIRGKEVKTGDVFTLADGLPPERVLKECEPIYKVVPGYKNSRNIKPGDPLPDDVARFLRCKITSGCVGNDYE